MNDNLPVMLVIALLATSVSTVVLAIARVAIESKMEEMRIEIKDLESANRCSNDRLSAEFGKNQRLTQAMADARKLLGEGDDE